MTKNKQGGYPATSSEHRHVSADSISSATEEALMTEGRGVQEDALMSGGPLGVEEIVEPRSIIPKLKDYPRARQGSDHQR